MSSILLRFLIYGCLGWSSEIMFTAIAHRASGQTRNWLLMGETSLWYFPMYGGVAFLYEPLHDFLRPQWLAHHQNHGREAVGLHRLAWRQSAWIDSLELCLRLVVVWVSP